MTMNLGGRPTKYPWYILEVGESFFTPGKKRHNMKKLSKRYKPKYFKCKEVMIKGVIGILTTRVQ